MLPLKAILLKARLSPEIADNFNPFIERVLLPPSSLSLIEMLYSLSSNSLVILRLILLVLRYIILEFNPSYIIDLWPGEANPGQLIKS
jgi:hypothetical protein